MDSEIQKLVKITKSKQNMKKRTNVNKHSLKYLINRNMTQSECIRLGIFLEKVLKDIILKFTKLRDINTDKNKKNTMEKDHLFIDDTNKKIYYAELKSNMYLDTEKRIATELKIHKIVNELQEKYQEYQIVESFVCLRYLVIPMSITKMYTITVISVNEYLNIIGCDVKFDEVEYYKFLNFCCDTLFDELE